MTDKPAAWSPDGYTPPDPAQQPSLSGRVPLVGDRVMIQLVEGLDPSPAIVTKVLEEGKANSALWLTVFGAGYIEYVEKAPYGTGRGFWYWRATEGA